MSRKEVDAIHRYIRKGLCIICGRPAVSGRKHCEEHLKMLRKTVANAASHIDYTKHPWIIDNKHIFEN